MLIPPFTILGYPACHHRKLRLAFPVLVSRSLTGILVTPPGRGCAEKSSSLQVRFRPGCVRANSTWMGFSGTAGYGQPLLVTCCVTAGQAAEAPA